MKNLAFTCTAILAASCSSPDPDMKGAYKMLSQNIKGDSTDVTLNHSQLKLYTEEYMMYTRYSPDDSVATFGICAYITNDNEVIESAIYSASGSTVSDSTQNYQLAIDWTSKGFQQAISGTDMTTGKNYVSTEVYQTVSSNKPSPLDGAWVMTSGYTITASNDTIPVTNGVAYKTYYAGSVLYGETMRDPMNVPNTSIGFGTFEMKGDNEVLETIQTASWPTMNGKTFSLAVTFNGPDEFTQVFAGEGMNSTQTYKRLGR